MTYVIINPNSKEDYKKIKEYLETIKADIHCGKPENGDSGQILWFGRKLTGPVEKKFKAIGVSADVWPE